MGNALTGRRRIFVVLGLAVFSIAYLGIKAVELLLTYPASWEMTWMQWLNIGGIVLVLIWYALFVLFAKERSWFGNLRRPATALILCALATGIAWWQSVSDLMLVAWATGGAIAGYFAEYWAEGL